MIEAKLEIHGLNETEERLEAVRRGIKRATFNAMSRAAKHLERRTKQALATGEHGIRSKRTLRQSITSSAFTSERDVVGVVGSPLVYARIHELGTVGAGGELPDIVPKRAGALTVPMGRLYGKNARASDYPDAFIIKTAGNKSYLVRKAGDQLEFLFALKQRVAIKARPYLSTTAENENQAIVGILSRQVEAMLQ